MGAKGLLTYDEAVRNLASLAVVANGDLGSAPPFSPAFAIQ